MADDSNDTATDVEPDYRFTLANERTFLAWQRTALGLLAAAVALVQLVPELTIPGARQVLGVVLAILAILTSGMGLLRWQQADRAMRRHLPLPRHPTGLPRGGALRGRGRRARIGGSQGDHRVNRHSTAASDRGLQAERTTLAWTRTAFALLVNGVLLTLKDTQGADGPAGLIPAGLAGAAASCCYVIALQRQRALSHRPLPARITPRGQVHILATAVLVLMVVTAFAQLL